MIYVASPYSHPARLVREERAELVAQYTAGLMSAGVLAYSPIAHGHAIFLAAGRAGLAMDFAFDAWRDHSLRMLRVCDKVEVLMLRGWDESAGVAAEAAAARAIGIPIRHVCPPQWLEVTS